MSTEQTSKIKSLLGTVAAGAAAVGGFILVQLSEQLGQMGGAWLSGALFFPLVLIVLCCWIASKVLGPEYDNLKIAIGVTGGQAIIFLLSGLFLGSEAMAAVLLDVIVLGAGTAWLVARPGVWPVALLLGFEILGLGANLLTLFGSGFQEEVVKGVVSWVLLRTAAIIFLINGLNALRARTAAPA